MAELDVNSIIDKLLDVRGARPGKQVNLVSRGWDGGGVHACFLNTPAPPSLQYAPHLLCAAV
jgi:hypothetical protein